MIIAVDLDRTLIKTDMFQESMLLLIKKNPLYVFSILFWLLRGRAFAKRKIAQRISFAPETLPYNRELLNWLKTRKQDRLVLATATDQGLAEKIAAHVGIFEAVHGSDGHSNLKAGKKRAFLIQHYGAGNYAYIGDSRADMAIFKDSNGYGFVGLNPRLKEKVKKMNPSPCLIDLF